MRKIILQLALVMIFMSSCYGQGLFIDGLDGGFTVVEQDELASVLSKLDSGVVELTAQNSIEDAYAFLSQRVLEEGSEDFMALFYGKIMEVFEITLKMDVSQELWWINPNSKSPEVNVKTEGKYLKYAELVGGKYPFFKEYYLELIQFQDIGAPHIVDGFALNAKEFNFKDENVRLIFGVHYMTLYNR